MNIRLNIFIKSRHLHEHSYTHSYDCFHEYLVEHLDERSYEFSDMVKYEY